MLSQLVFRTLNWTVCIGALWILGRRFTRRVHSGGDFCKKGGLHQDRAWSISHAGHLKDPHRFFISSLSVVVDIRNNRTVHQ